MRAIILAAGIGYRLLPITKHIPKCMVRVAGKPILEYALDGLLANGIEDIVIVVGYHKELIRRFVEKTYGRDTGITFVENDIYDTTNNIYSFWMAADYFDDDILLLESDIVFEHEILTRLLAHQDPNVVVVDPNGDDNLGTMVRVDEKGRIFHLMTREHQQYPHERSGLFKTVNIYKLSKGFLKRQVYPVLKNYIDTQSYSKYYEVILGLIIYMNVPELTAMTVDGLKWYEIDTCSDLDKAEFLFSPPARQIAMIETRFGGLWNYPGFTDFVYMKNTYFPPDELVAAMKRHTGDLIRNYSSGQRHLNKKAAMLEYLDEDHLFLFNGSSQGIQCLSSVLGKIALPVPAFQEYVHTFEPDRLHEHVLPFATFEPDLDRLADEALAAFSDSLVVVNPNNPTSALIEKKDLEDFLREWAHRFRFVVVDESFIDFAGQEHSLKQAVDRFDNLVIIKSLGKAYGVAGLRLGYIYSRNRDIGRACERYLPIWNINAFAEFFMEEALKYRDEFSESLVMIRQDRDDLAGRLQCIPCLRIIAPHGNFIMAEVLGTSPLDPANLKEKLFTRYSLLIKDVTGKIRPFYPDMNSRGFIRMAALGKPDNDRLCDGLEEFLT